MSQLNNFHLAKKNSSFGLKTKFLDCVCLSENSNFALKTLDRFEKITGKYKLTLITGPGSANHETIKAKAKISRHSIEVLREVIDMPVRMCKTHLAITTAGLNTLSELALINTPAIV